ncbi:hypothetical protein [Streptomyces sp. NPDC059909]|uniref:hypothetical protein n=1 Tax=Streptomyces sp. NPDC059909 TaxID=3346998 RepID=UPI003658162D
MNVHWEAMADGEVAGVGLEVVVLGEAGRITADHQFIESRRGPWPGPGTAAMRPSAAPR